MEPLSVERAGSVTDTMDYMRSTCDALYPITILEIIHTLGHAKFITSSSGNENQSEERGRCFFPYFWSEGHKYQAIGINMKKGEYCKP